MTAWGFTETYGAADRPEKDVVYVPLKEVSVDAARHVSEGRKGRATMVSITIGFDSDTPIAIAFSHRGELDEFIRALRRFRKTVWGRKRAITAARAYEDDVRGKRWLEANRCKVCWGPLPSFVRVMCAVCSHRRGVICE